MNFLSMGFKACCAAAILAGGPLTPVVVFAAPAVAAGDADYAMISHAIDKFQFFEMMASGMRDASVYNDAAWSLTPGQQEVLTAAFYRELIARKPAITEGMRRKAAAAFTHDEIVRIAALADKPGAARFVMALVGQDFSAVENDPFAKKMSDSDAELFFRLTKALGLPDVKSGAETQAAFDIALAEAKSPVGLAARPTITPDYNRFRAATQPLRVFDIVSAVLMEGLRRSEVMADIPPEKHEAFLAAAERGLKDRRDAITESVLREAFKTINYKDVEGLTAISRRPDVSNLADDLVEMAYKLEDVNIFETLSEDPALADMDLKELSLVRRYFIIITNASSVPSDELSPVLDAATKSVGIRLYTPSS